MQTCSLGGRGGEQGAHVLRFTRADIFVERLLGLRDDDGWRTQRCSMRELALRPCTRCSPPFRGLVCALASQRNCFHKFSKKPDLQLL